jgi:uncharacterized protein
VTALLGSHQFFASIIDSFMSLFQLLPTDPWFYIIGFIATFLMALGKGAFGGGLAIIGVPLMAMVVDPITAAIIIAPLVVFMDLFALRAFPSSTWSRPDLPWLLAGLFVGILIGWLTFEIVDRRIVTLLIASVTLAFTLRWFFKHRSTPPPPHDVQPLRATFLATLSGFTTFIAHAGGPPVAIYLLGRNLGKSVFAGTTIIVFMFGNIIKLVPYTKLALEQPMTMAAALVFAPIAPLGIYLGKKLHDRLDQDRMFFWCYILLLVTGTKMLWDSIRAFL